MRLIRIISIFIVVFIGCNYNDLNIINNKIVVANKYNYQNSYVAYLNIPRINLNMGLYDIKSPLNDIKYNIAFLPNTSYPKDNSNTVIVGHSGNSQISFFKDLEDLDINDPIYFYYNNQKYEFYVANIYNVLKTGKVSVVRNKDEQTLTLITCIENDKQLVVVCYKKNTNN